MTLLFMQRRSLIFWSLVSFLSILLTLFWGSVVQLHRAYLKMPKDPLVGDKPATLAALKNGGLPISFLVMGDSSLNQTAQTLIRKASRQGDASFLVIVGDFVTEPDLWYHRWFLMEMTQDIQPAFPVFLAPGNHDIDWRSLIRKAERRVTPEVYDSLYGARNFSFVFNDCLFIICGIDLQNPASYLNYLEETLSQKGVGRKYIFVFAHHPPKDLANYIEGNLPMEDRFYSLLETYKVTACFFGDYHGYWRGQRNGVNLIVSGGGGRLKASQPEWGKFNHILKMTVDPRGISEGILILPEKRFDLGNSMEKWAFIYVLPLVEGGVGILYLFFFCSFSCGILSVIISLRLFLTKYRSNASS